MTPAFQVGLICWLGEHQPVQPRPVKNAPELKLVGNASAEWLDLTDPTLFALPHPRGFSGPAWLASPRLPLPPLTWSEPESWLPVPTQALGAALRLFIQTNQFAHLELPAKPTPKPFVPPLVPIPAAEPQSSFRLAGGLIQRPLLAPPALRSWPPCIGSAKEPEFLANSVVQLLVDAGGRPVSATLISTSGSSDADRFALAQAREVRFEPVEAEGADRAAAPSAQLTWGELIFQWHTLTAPITNAPKEAP